MTAPTVHVAHLAARAGGSVVRQVRSAIDPSATRPAMRSIHGFTPATSTGGSATSRRPGDH